MAWAMKRTAFFYVGAGDLTKSILTAKAENVYGIITPDNRMGRGIRFGIAEQSMAMMSTAMAQDILLGGFRPMPRVDHPPTQRFFPHMDLMPSGQLLGGERGTKIVPFRLFQNRQRLSLRGG